MEGKFNMKTFGEILISETNNIEFKESLEISKPKSWLKTISAFANGIGGSMFWGVSDDRKVVGLTNAQQTIERISEIIKIKIEPMLQSRIFCTRWNGLDKGSIFDDAIDDKEYKGNLISLLENGITFIKNNSKVMWKKTPSGRDEKPDYPERSVFEAMVNALIHRDYMILGSEVHIDMYDNRLEITSPGGMLDGKRIQEIDILHVPSSRRNPIISDVFHRLKFMERRGSGLKKILKEYEAENSPLFYSDQQYFTVTLINKNYGTKKTTQRTIQRTTQRTIQKTEERILALITQDPTITQNDIATQLGDITPSGVKYNLKKLRSKGLINRIGADNGGYWVIIDVLQGNGD